MSDASKTEVKPASPPPPGPPPKAAPKNPGMVTFTVDGQEVVAKPGTNMIDAAKTVGVEIPYYCYHPRLSIAANCRMCLVESSGAPKLVPACQTAIQEGVAIKTDTAKVNEQQRAVMEFLLLNHPVDCSICDQAGECKLQDYYMRYDHKPSRLPGMKVMRDKRKVLGPTVVLDQERCVMCTRCVRFMAEVAKEPQLGVFGRGSHEVIDVFPEQGGLTSNYSGNVVDICPVGALLNRDFRFRARAWFLSASPSVCTGCSRGCSTYADFMGQDVYRYRPRENDAINQSWMCDQGRLTYKRANQNRVEKNFHLSGATTLVVDKAQAAKVSAGLLNENLGSTTVVVSPQVSNEEALAFLSFAKETLRANDIYVSGFAAGAKDDFLMLSDKNPNRKGVEEIAKAFGLNVKHFSDLEKAQGKSIVFFGADVPAADDVVTKIISRFASSIVMATNAHAWTQKATVVLASTSHFEDEGTFTQETGITQRFRRAFPPKFDSQPGWKWVAEISKAMNVACTYTSSRDVFKALASKVASLSTFNWDKEAPINQKKPGITPLPTGADGRPPGYREMGAPRVRGI